MISWICVAVTERRSALDIPSAAPWGRSLGGVGGGGEGGEIKKKQLITAVSQCSINPIQIHQYKADNTFLFYQSTLDDFLFR